jgi:DNA-binding MurR/RpiR family transcriptional regulator
VNNANARNFTYLASTGMTSSTPSRAPARPRTDDLAWADGRDVLIAMTCRPYRAEVVEAVRSPANRG